jgi:HEAT repeat protein
MRNTNMNSKMVVMSLLLAAALVPIAQAEVAPPLTADALLADLVKDNGPVQARARQLLPRFGAEAVPGLVKLLGDKDEHIWRTAMVVLRDIAHQTVPIRMDSEEGVPGRVAVEKALMPLVSADQSPVLVKRALSLLPFVVAEETNVSPIAVLLTNADLRERARACLEECGTVGALEAIVAAAETHPDMGFQYALLNALFGKTAKLGDMGFAVRLCDSPSGVVRASAARLLAETANPEYEPQIIAVVEKADDASRFEAWDAGLRYADAVARGGGKWAVAMNAYRTILSDAPDTTIKSGAIAGLGRYGDESSIPLFLEAMAAPDGAQVASPVLNALCALEGHAANLALLEVWPKLPADMQAGLVQNLGARRDVMFMPLLAEKAASEDAALRMAALKGLSLSGLPEAAPLLAKALESAGEQDRPVIGGWVKRYAEDLSAQNKPEAAGRAYVSLYRNAADPELKAIGLEGIRKYPVPEAFDVVMEMLNKGELDTIPVGSMIAIANAAIAAGQQEQGQKLLGGVMGKLTTPEAVQQTVAALGTMKEGPELAAKLGFVKQWAVIGPLPWRISDGFTKNIMGEPQVDLKGRYPGMGGEVTWKAASTDDLAGMVNLAGLIGMVDSAVAFAYTEIEVAADEDIMVHGGSDDGLKIWVNGEAVSEQDVDRPFKVDSDNAPAKLKAGKNALVVMISQRAGGWGFGVRISRADGTVPEFKVIQPQP